MPISKVDAGMYMLLKLLHFSKALEPITRNDFGRINSFKRIHSLNADGPTISTLLSLILISCK